MDEVSIPQGISVKGYTVTSIKETTTNTELYNSTSKKITKANVKAALGGKTFAQAAATDVKTLLAGKTIAVTLQDASGYQTTYTVRFN